jgi:hypothetical protein
MTDDKSVVAELGARLTARAGEHIVVNLRNGGDATAYITDDLVDAIEHGRALRHDDRSRRMLERCGFSHHHSGMDDEYPVLTWSRSPKLDRA